MDKRRTTRLIVAGLGLALALAVAGCGGQKQEKQQGGEATPAPAPAPQGPKLTVSGAWARPAAEGVSTSAVYLTIKNEGDQDDALLGASTDVAGKVELHQTKPMAEAQAGASMQAGGEAMKDEHGGHAGGDMKMEGQAGMQMGGMAMQMVPVEKVAVPAGGTVELKPGGLHIMLMDLKRPLAAGDRFTVTLRFERSGEQQVEVEVRQP